MRFFSRLSPFRAINDLRSFLAQRHPRELAILFASLVLTTLLIAGFIVDSNVPVPYKRDIVYFKSWPANRSLDDIMADRRRDFVLKTRTDVLWEKRQADSKATWRKYDNALTKWGI